MTWDQSISVDVSGRNDRCEETDPWSIGDIGILDNNQLANGPGISKLQASSFKLDS